MGKYDFSNKKVIITGAANGLGYYISCILAKKGSNLILIDKDLKNLNKLKNHLKDQVDIYHHDLKDINNFKNILDQIHNKHDNIDCIKFRL